MGLMASTTSTSPDVGRVHSQRFGGRRRWFAGVVIAVLAFGLLGAGCVPKPTAGSVDVAGDSLTIQSFFNGGFGDGAPSDLNVIAGLGWTAPDAQPRVSEDIKNARPEVLVVALATNDANPGSGGWTDQDVANFRTMINSPHPDACVVVVTPGYGPTLDDAFKQQIYEARLALRQLIAERPRTVEADWYVVTRDHPEYITSDGIHLSGEEAWHARSALYWQGMAKCPEPIPAETTTTTSTTTTTTSTTTTTTTAPPSETTTTTAGAAALGDSGPTSTTSSTTTTLLPPETTTTTSTLAPPP
jgi:hypothetical protein